MKISKFVILLFTPLMLCAGEGKNYAQEFSHSLFYDFYPSAFDTLQEWERSEDIKEALPFLAYLLYEAQKPTILSFPQVSHAVNISPPHTEARRIMEKVYLFFDEELWSPDYDGQ